MSWIFTKKQKNNMRVKICTKCDNELPATAEFFHKMKAGKYGLRSVCKPCAKKYRKIYTSTDEYKKKHRIKMAKWRAEHPEKALEISRKNYRLHGEKHNAKRREKYKTDPVFRDKCIERERKYKESGRRYEMGAKPENREKAKIRSKKRRTDPLKLEHDYKMSAKWREKNKEHLINLHNRKRKELYPSYVACCLRISVKDLTPELLELSRKTITLFREIKTIKQLKK